MAAPTTVGDLLDYVRLQLNSEKVGGVDTHSLWTDSEIIDYIDQAQQEFSRLTLSVPDYSTFTASLLADTDEYAFDTRILEIFGGYLNSTQKRVTVKSFNELEKGWMLQSDRVESTGDWENQSGTPKFIVPNIEAESFIVWPNPNINETLRLYTYKVADHVDATGDSLEIDSQYRLGLSLKVMALAYGKHDTIETEDLQRSMLYSQKWKSFWQDAKQTYDLRFKR